MDTLTHVPNTTHSSATASSPVVSTSVHATTPSSAMASLPAASVSVHVVNEEDWEIPYESFAAVGKFLAEM